MLLSPNGTSAVAIQNRCINVYSSSASRQASASFILEPSARMRSRSSGASSSRKSARSRAWARASLGCRGDAFAAKRNNEPRWRIASGFEVEERAFRFKRSQPLKFGQQPLAARCFFFCHGTALWMGVEGCKGRKVKRSRNCCDHVSFSPSTS